jgi:hypothetical protein
VRTTSQGAAVRSDRLAEDTASEGAWSTEAFQSARTLHSAEPVQPTQRRQAAEPIRSVRPAWSQPALGEPLRGNRWSRVAHNVLRWHFPFSRVVPRTVSNTRSPPDAAAQGPESDRTCMICRSAPRNSIFYPCGHQCACFDCARIREEEELTRSDEWDTNAGIVRCPVCRQTSVDMIRTYDG